MSSSSSVVRATVFAAALGSLTAPALADAKPRRIVVLDFDGPRTLADSGRDAVVRVLGAQYDFVAAKRWLDAKATATTKQRGPRSWEKASQQTGVDAVIEGWVQDEGKSKVLSVVITEASSGHALDTLTIKLSAGGVGEETLFTLRKELEARLDWIAVDLDPPAPPSPKDKAPIGSQQNPPATAPAQQIGPDLPPPASQPAIAAATPAPAVPAAPTASTTSVFEGQPGASPLPQPPLAAPRPVRRFWFAGGPGYDSRTLSVGAENPDGVTQYASVPHKSIGIEAACYPFPRAKHAGVPDGIGFSFAIDHSLGSTVTFDNLDEVGDYSIDQYAWNAGVHYRAVLGQLALDGEVGYGQHAYKITDAPMDFEVPDTSYQFVSAGGHLDLAITERSSVGFGAKYLHVFDQGDLTSVDWYGPGKSSGISLDGNFMIPLPANLFVRGELAYTRIKTSFDGAGEITEQEGVFEAVDSQIGGSVKLGVRF